MATALSSIANWITSIITLFFTGKRSCLLKQGQNWYSLIRTANIYLIGFLRFDFTRWQPVYFPSATWCSFYQNIVGLKCFFIIRSGIITCTTLPICEKVDIIKYSKDKKEAKVKFNSKNLSRPGYIEIIGYVPVFTLHDRLPRKCEGS